MSGGTGGGVEWIERTAIAVGVFILLGGYVLLS